MFLELIKDPKIFNLVISGIVLLVGLLIYWFHPAVFHEHLFVEKSFEFWVLKWMAYVMTWGLLTAQADLRFILALNDLNSVIGLGFVVALWQGDSYDERHTIVNLLFLFGLLFSWNFIARPLMVPGMVWIFPSMTTSFVFISGMGFVVAARYGKSSLGFVIVTALYIILQLPAYQVVFLGSVTTDPELVRLLAFGKALYASLFYAVFSAPIKNFGSIQIPLPSLPGLSERQKRAATWAAGAIGGGLLTELTLWIGKVIFRLFTGHPLSS
jgi:hypothetical protein